MLSGSWAPLLTVSHLSSRRERVLPVRPLLLDLAVLAMDDQFTSVLARQLPATLDGFGLRVAPCGSSLGFLFCYLSPDCYAMLTAASAVWVLGTPLLQLLGHRAVERLTGW